jgi:hypothetical protein
VKISLRLAVLAVLVALGAGFYAGVAWRRHTHPTAAEKFDETSRSLRKGLFGE